MRESRKFTQQLSYALPVIGVAFLMGPLTILQGIYAKYFSVPLTTIALVLLVSRLFDAVTDPLIGYFSDRCHARWGTRKHFVAIGGGLLILSSYFLYVPVDIQTIGPATNVSGAYFLVWFLAFYLSYTLFDIPHLAWGGEISSNSVDKNTVYGLRVAMALLGTLVFYAVPLLPVFDTNEFTPQTLEWSVIAAGALLLPMLYVCVTRVSNTEHTLIGSSKRNSQTTKENSYALVSSIFRNIPFLLFMAAFFCTGAGVGMWIGMLFLFVDSYLGLGNQFSWVYVITTGISLFAVIGGAKLANCWSKKVVWSLGVWMIVMGLLGTGLLKPIETGAGLLLLNMSLIYIGLTAVNVVAPSLLADIVDYSKWKSGQNQSGTYFSVYTLVSKANMAIGASASLLIAEWYGFNASVSTHSQEVIVGLLLSVAWIPASIVMMSVPFILCIPITARRHEIILLRLRSRAAVQESLAK